MSTDSLNPSRLRSVDALRGFAVMAICLLHNIEHFIYGVYPTDSGAFMTALDKGVHDALFFIFAGKSYAIFALLFGFTYWIQYSNRVAQGKDFAGRYLWRLLLLLGFGTLNALFFPGGDVLVLFAITGIFLIPVRKWSDGWLVAGALLLLAQPVELYRLILLVFSSDYHLPAAMADPIYAELKPVVDSGNWGEMFRWNAWQGQKASLFWALDNGRFLQTAGLFIVGFLLAKKKKFADTPQNSDFWTKAFIGGLVASFILYALNRAAGQLPDAREAKVLSAILTMWYNAAFTAVIVSVFMMLYRTEYFRRIGRPLEYYGKTSLTNYVTQSVIGALIYFPVGLNLAPVFGTTVSLLTGFGMIALQIAFSRWWLRTHSHGLLEGIWFKLTWWGTRK